MLFILQTPGIEISIRLDYQTSKTSSPMFLAPYILNWYRDVGFIPARMVFLSCGQFYGAYSNLGLKAL